MLYILGRQEKDRETSEIYMLNCGKLVKEDGQRAARTGVRGLQNFNSGSGESLTEKEVSCEGLAQVESGAGIFYQRKQTAVPLRQECVWWARQVARALQRRIRVKAGKREETGGQAAAEASSCLWPHRPPGGADFHSEWKVLSSPFYRL